MDSGTDFADPWIAAVFLGLTAVILLAAWLGGAPERLGVLLLGSTASTQVLVNSYIAMPLYGSVDPVSVLVDAAHLVGFFAIMMRADRKRIWPIVATSMALLSLGAHYGRLDPEVLGFTYAQMKSLPTVALPVIVLCGVIMHRLRVARGINDFGRIPLKKWAEYRAISRRAGLKKGTVESQK